MRVGINGMGRIGRLALRAAFGGVLRDGSDPREDRRVPPDERSDRRAARPRLRHLGPEGLLRRREALGPEDGAVEAGRQQFRASVPKAPTYVLTRGTAYLFEVWDSEGRVQRHGFTL